MAKTRHIQHRMSERSISNAMLKLTRQFGVSKGNKQILNRKGCDAALKALEQLKKDLLRARKRDGLVLVEKDDMLITTYSLSSYSRNKAQAHH